MATEYIIPSGINFMPETDLGSNIGSVSKRFNNIYANNISGNFIGLTGMFLPLTGGTLTGNLNISGTNTEYKLTSTNGDYSRITRATTADQLNIKNQLSIIGNPSALGGTIITSGLYTYHTFSGNGTFDSTLAGTLNIDYLLVGGGGQGGSWGGGGAGGGGFLSGTISTTAGSYPIVVGSGGSGGTSTQRGVVGSGSTWNSLTGGGGGGGGGSNSPSPIGGSGTASNGNGGGGGFNSAGGVGEGSGFAGAAGSPNTGGCFGEGGGGGAGAVGTNVAPITAAGVGGVGKVWLDGITYAGGGGGGLQAAGTQGTGGAGGGGNGCTNPTFTDASAGTDGLGGGGGGAGPGNAGPKGGSGIVKLRYLTPTTTTQEANLVQSINSATSGEYGVNTFGDGTGQTHINGNRIYFDIGGVNKGFINSSGIAVIHSGIAIKDTNNVQWLLTPSTSGTTVWTSGTWV